MLLISEYYKVIHQAKVWINLVGFIFAALVSLLVILYNNVATFYLRNLLAHLSPYACFTVIKEVAYFQCLNIFLRLITVYHFIYSVYT